jgi:hypothetical protein
VIGRGHLAGPCPALSYVERAILLLEFLTFFFFLFSQKNKKKKIQIFKYNKTSSADPFFSFLSSPQIFPPSLHLPQNLPTVNHRSELRRPSGSGDQFRTSPPPFRAPSFFRFRRGVSHKPATIPSSVILPVPTRCFARASHRSELRHSSGSDEVPHRLLRSPSPSPTTRHCQAPSPSFSIFGQSPPTGRRPVPAGFPRRPFSSSGFPPNPSPSSLGLRQVLKQTPFLHFYFFFGVMLVLVFNSI